MDSEIKVGDVVKDPARPLPPPEPLTSGYGGLAGVYRYDRKPR